MKTLKITLLLAVFVLTISALSINKEPKTVDIEKYQELKKDTDVMATLIKKDRQKPPPQNL